MQTLRFTVAVDCGIVEPLEGEISLIQQRISADGGSCTGTPPQTDGQIFWETRSVIFKCVFRSVAGSSSSRLTQLDHICYARHTDTHLGRYVHIPELLYIFLVDFLKVLLIFYDCFQFSLVAVSFQSRLARFCWDFVCFKCFALVQLSLSQAFVYTVVCWIYCLSMSMFIFKFNFMFERINTLITKKNTTDISCVCWSYFS